MTTTLKDLGAFIHATRKNRRWSLRDMAQRCNTSFSTISRIENGEDCTLSNLIDVATAFNMQVGDMLVCAGYTDGEAHQRAAVMAVARLALEIGLKELERDE